jgi:alpha-amylase
MARKSIRLQLAFHHHQPVGNFTEAMDACCRGGYLPLLRAIERAAPVKFHLSYSGPVLEHLAARVPEYLELLESLVGRGQVEVLAAAHYEPILADLEEEDRTAHIEASLAWWQARLGVRPRGLWLAEGVWEDSLAGTLHRAGITHTLLAKERFIQGGAAPGRVQGYFTTDHHGRVCRIFPIEEGLQRLMPFGKVEDLVQYLRRQAGRGDAVLTFADNAERWGVWEGTGERVLLSGHADQLFAALRDNADWVQTWHFSEVLNRVPSSGRCSLPPGVSKELGIWSLPDEARSAFQQARQNLEVRFDADQFLPYFRTGSWGGFRVRYREANWMHQFGRFMVQRARQAGDPGVRERALRWLHEAQCNTAYWYGTSGGIYAPHLREAVWSRLLQARALTAPPGPSLIEEDIDADGNPEILAETGDAAAWVLPAAGGGLAFWARGASPRNVLNIMTRHQESTLGRADRTIQERDAQGAEVDRMDRAGFLDLFLKRQATAEELAAGRSADQGDFYGRPWRVLESGIGEDGVLRLRMERAAAVVAGHAVPVRVRKSLALSPDGGLVLAWEIANEGSVPLHTVHGVEVGFGFTGPEVLLGSGGHGRPAGQAWYEGQAREVWMASGPAGLKVRLEWQGAGPLWSYPLSVTQGDGRAVFQGQAMVVGHPVDLEPGAACSWSLRASIVTI